MNEQENRKRLNRILRDLSDELDVPPSKYREAKEHYDAVGAWLGDDDSELAPYEPTIYPQGSFAFGTAVRPLGDDEYDVDAVCLLQLSPDQVTQQQLKALVGDRLKHQRSRYEEMLEPPDGGRRCWTIQYADASKFHLDVLPAIPDDYGRVIALGVPEKWAQHAICLTDRKTWSVDPEWPRSNPKGYIAWFKDCMRVRLDEAKHALAVAKQADVETIEDFDVRTPLQRLIQILKRHRDVRYNGDDDKPISIIITTLAARAYDNETDLAEAILNVVPRMRQSIEQRDGVWWVPNPVNPQENFADKWTEPPRKAEIFFEWLTAVEQQYRNLLSDKGWNNVGEHLEAAFGSRDAKAAIAKYAAREARQPGARMVAPAVLTPRKSEHPTNPKIELPSNPGKPWRP
ncbi:hypothetical protein MELA_00088 [Candidatus Methylomirabilis lanthanidiphila]|uniref:Cyclic GMP-AMP synthase n=1 Tax=Candidatus Methylomirabilis lanthanidiphila TaxID=2211376 RepID=A0A564ZEJ0_9BACT|nr:nucleotidyltransferase [Candidatus Methylomirabilis lanthanidiphila]VUZ83735.1 hypothetical protein MELA_00088 [Candidatus Methylomirabilis lanthanidiphila]